MMRYVRLYGRFVAFSFSRALEFRLDFFFRVVMDCAYYAVNLAFYKVIFLHTSMLGGWREDQALVFAAGYLLLDALNMTVFANNMWVLPILINRGDLDYYLVRPVSSLFFVSLREFAANSFLNLVMAAGILIWALGQYADAISPWRLGLYLLLLVNGTLLYHMLRLSTIIPVFWMHSGRGFEQLYWGLQRFMERPDGIFRGWLRRVLLSLLPFSLMASFPARLFLEEFSWSILGHIMLVTVLLALFVRWFWSRGLRAYSSASS